MMKKIFRLVWVLLWFFVPYPGAVALTPEYEAERTGRAVDHTRIAPQERDRFSPLEWEDMVPENWNPSLPFDGLDIDAMEDNDPRLAHAMEKFKKLWDEAPVNPQLKGRAVRIAGFVVTLEYEEKNLREFLLVPYFGACIHVPPPPANQMIYVHSEKSLQGFFSMDPVWVYGILDTERNDTEMGNVGYTMQAVKVEHYTSPAK